SGPAQIPEYDRTETRPVRPELQPAHPEGFAEARTGRLAADRVQTTEEEAALSGQRATAGAGGSGQRGGNGPETAGHGGLHESSHVVGLTRRRLGAQIGAQAPAVGVESTAAAPAGGPAVEPPLIRRDVGDEPVIVGSPEERPPVLHRRRPLLLREQPPVEPAAHRPGARE